MATIVVTILGTLALASPALAALPRPPFTGVPIDAYAPYQGQTTCDPTPKPGVVDFRNILLAEYPGRSHSISRACNVGGQSEHKEGRALDFAFNVSNATQASQARAVLSWLLATDSAGNRHALLRRFGIMYVIWNRQIFQASQASAGWQTYTGSNPHTDHIHFSFSWKGARQQTSWWTRRTPPTGPTMAYDLGNGTMRIFRWTSTGSAFTGPSTYTSGPFGLSAVAGRMASGDVSGDGKDDTVMAYQNSDGTFSYHVWNGGLTYAGRWYTSGAFTLVNVGDRFNVGDYNGDGKADAAMAYDLGNGTMRIYVWTSSGSGFTGPATYTSGSFSLGAVAGRMASGDVNGDGKDDIVMAYQNSDGTFSYHVWNAGLTYTGRCYTSGAFTLGNVGDRFTVGDYTGDGKADAAMAYDLGDGTMRIFRWTSTGCGFSGPATYTSGSFGLSAVAGRMASGDVNADGKDDIVMAYQNSDGSFSYHVWKGALTHAGRWYTSGPFTLGNVGNRLTLGGW